MCPTYQTGCRLLDLQAVEDAQIPVFGLRYWTTLDTTVLVRRAETNTVLNMQDIIRENTCKRKCGGRQKAWGNHQSDLNASLHLRGGVKEGSWAKGGLGPGQSKESSGSLEPNSTFRRVMVLP